MRKSLGNKRNELSNGNIAEIVELYGDVTKNGRSKVFDNEDFGYRQIKVDRPLRLAFQVTPERHRSRRVVVSSFRPAST